MTLDAESLAEEMALTSGHLMKDPKHSWSESERMVYVEMFADQFSLLAAEVRDITAHRQLDGADTPSTSSGGLSL